MITPDRTLQWPSHFPPRNRWKQFFIGVRWLGPDLSFFKNLRELQEKRRAEALSAWLEGEQRDVAFVMGKAFQTELGWPTPYFLPADNFHVIAYGPRFQSIDDLGFSSAAAKIERQLQRQFPKTFWKQCVHQNMLFGSVIVDVLALPHAANTSKSRWKFWLWGRKE